jgi:acyl carrier protein
VTADRPLPERVRRAVAQQLGLAPSELVPEARLVEDLGADSLDLVELVMALEEIFDVELPEADVEPLRTIADLEQYLLARLRA